MKKSVSKLLAAAAIAFAFAACQDKTNPTPSPTPTPTPTPDDTLTCVVNIDFQVSEGFGDIFAINKGEYTLGEDITFNFAELLTFTSGWSVSNNRAEVQCTSTLVLDLADNTSFVPAQDSTYDIMLDYVYAVSVINQKGKVFDSVRLEDKVGYKGLNISAALTKYTRAELYKILTDAFNVNYKVTANVDGSLTVKDLRNPAE